MTGLYAVLHVHSDWSYDGRWTLAGIASLYGRLGVQALLMSEHDTGFDPGRFSAYREACAAASTDRCRLVPGIEYSSPDNDVHILTWGVESFLAEHRPVIETLKAVRDAGGVSLFAHPVRHDSWKRLEPDWVALLSGIEVWNRKSDGIAPGKHAVKLVESTNLSPTVGQDFHSLRQLYPLTMQMNFEREPGEDLESKLVQAIREQRMAPLAFGRPLYNDRGTLLHWPHTALERTRAGLRDLRDSFWTRRRG